PREHDAQPALLRVEPRADRAAREELRDQHQGRGRADGAARLGDGRGVQRVVPDPLAGRRRRVRAHVQHRAGRHGAGARGLEKLARGEPLLLRALRLHNGTVYRWNRPCYGITDGKPHLRIEARVLPSGPTVLDEVANAALWYGLMNAFAERGFDVTQGMKFED